MTDEEKGPEAQRCRAIKASAHYASRQSPTIIDGHFHMAVVMPADYPEREETNRTYIAHVELEPSPDETAFGTRSCRIIIRRFGSHTQVNLHQTYITLVGDVSESQQHCLCDNCRPLINQFLEQNGGVTIDVIMQAVDAMIDRALNGEGGDDSVTGFLSNLPISVN